MRLIVTVDGSWDIYDSFLVPWYNYVMRRMWDKRDVILHDHVQTNPEFHKFVKN